MLVGRDHNVLYDAAGMPTGGFDQIMLIYPEAGAVHTDYTDGTHVIHYHHAEVTPGRAVVFTSDAPTGAPTFRLSHTLIAAGRLAMSFAMAPPGSATFQPIATGDVTRIAP